MVHVMGSSFDGAAEFFEEAERAARRVASLVGKRQLMHEAAVGMVPRGMGGGRGGHRPDRMEATMAALVDWERRAEAEAKLDYTLLDLAAAVLYGSPQVDGVADLCKPWWADAVDLHHLKLLTWPQVAGVLGHPRPSCSRAARAAFDVCDRYRLIEEHVRHHDAEGWVLDLAE